MMGVADGKMWATRVFSRKVEDPSEDSEPAVSLVVQEWIEARVQIAMEEANAAALNAREQREINLASAIEEVAARSFAQMSAEIARTAALMTASLDSIREKNERRVQIGTLQAMSHAEQGVAAMGSALKGVAKALASLKRDVENSTALFKRGNEGAAAFKQETERAIRGVESDLIAIQDALEGRIAAHERQIGSVAAEVGSLVAEHGALASRLASHDAQLAAVEAGVEASVSDHAGLESRFADQHAEIASVAEEIGSAVSDYNAQLRSVEKRLEFVRQETMYEMQASIMRVAGKRSGENSQTIAKIVNPDKVEAMRKSGLRLNIGCGHIQHDDYINVDARNLPGVDVIAEATDIPFAPEEIQEIASAHLVEHFTAHILDRVLLPYWKSLLKPGAQLTTVAPDGAAMLAAVNDGTMPFEDFREVIFGAQDYDGDFHYNLITPGSFRDALTRAGFVGIEEVYTERKNGKCFEFKTIARKP